MNIHEQVSKIIISEIIEKIKNCNTIYVITLAGESGCGKTETGEALVKELESKGISAMLMGQDNYFYLPPLANDAARKKDPTWLGPRKEVNLELLNKNLLDAQNGAKLLDIHHIDYDTNIESVEKINIENTKVIIVEGTYTSLLKYVDTRIFIDEDYHETLKYRKMRNRGNEVHDPFVENILETEHKIISGHIFLADFIITKNYEVVNKESLKS